MAQGETVGVPEIVATFHGPMPTGVSVSQTGRIFVNYPKWGDKLRFTVAELRNGEAYAFPDEATNRTNDADQAAALVSVQSIVVDPADRLWILDTGSPMFQPTQYGGPKLVCVDLTTNTIVQKILFPTDVSLPTTYLNDVRFDLRRGKAGDGVYHRLRRQGTERHHRGRSRDRRELAQAPRLPEHEGGNPARIPADGRGPAGGWSARHGPPKPVTMGADGIASGHDGARLFYCPLASRHLYSVSIDMLIG